jgi:hypothetical protein
MGEEIYGGIRRGGGVEKRGDGELRRWDGFWVWYL